MLDVGRKKTAPPPPPTVNEHQQAVGLSLRNTDALAYTIGGSTAGKRIEIDDLRFKWVNALLLPQPRRFEGRQKLYPSGRGSLVPLDLSLYD